MPSMPSMPTLTVNGLKKSAANAKDSMGHAIDRQKSMPMKKTNWNPYDPNAPRPQEWVPPVKPKQYIPPPPVRQDSAANANSSASVGSGSSSIQKGPPPTIPSRGSAPPPVPVRKATSSPGLPPRALAVAPPAPARSPIPPPMPSRSPSTAPSPLIALKPGPPPVLPRRSTPAVPNLRNTAKPEESEEFQWSTISPSDKEIFFGWMDEFFGVKKPTGSSILTGSYVGLQRGSASSGRVMHGHFGASNPPTMHVSASNTSGFTMSYPPPATHGSAACDFAHYMAPSTHWDQPWYLLDKPVPPPLINNPDVRYTYSYHRHGHTKTYAGAVLFEDLSLCWYSIQFTTETESDPTKVTRTAQYLSRPNPLGKAALLEGHRAYGDGVAALAESFVGSGSVCARGECWDMANEGLKQFESQPGVPRPVPSIARTHGHLIFEGRATGKGQQSGRWRGGDDTIRRGDVVEWRKARLNVVHAQPGSWMQLGVPEHTSIVVKDAKPDSTPTDGGSVLPSALRTLEVVEQMHGVAPRRMVYDLDAFEGGEMWIYRPVGMKIYIGSALEMTCPPDVHPLTL